MLYSIEAMRCLQFLLLSAIFACLSCQTQSKSSETKATPLPPGDPWFASARLGDWAQLEKLQKDLNRDWDYKSPTGTTALMIAARNGHTEVIKNLLNKNAKINETDQHKYNVLSYAIHGPTPPRQKQDMCKFLVENGADAFAEDQLQLTPIQIMIELGFIQCIKAIKLSKAKPCDQAERLTQIKSLVTYAKDEDEPVIALHFATQGCQ